MYKNKKSNNTNGITLIALIITIIIMLILVAVTVSMAINGGLFEKAGQAVGDIGNEINKEQELANGRIQIDGTWYDSIDDYLNKRPSENQGAGNSEETINWEEILADANTDPEKYKHPDQSSSNGDIGIGTDGQPVNLDLWTYTVINEKEIGLYKPGGYGPTPGYKNSNITAEGKIIGQVPQYIKINGNIEFYPVTSMEKTFDFCNSLVTAPEIPTSVTNMYYTFDECRNLTTAPEIPTGVTNMEFTFYNCLSLTTPPPKIPSSVTNMGATFSGCTSLTTPPVILAGVTDMGGSFSGCSSLKTAPEIPSSVTSMNTTFSGCTSLTTAPEIPSSVTNMRNTFSGCTSLTTAPEIPDGVTNVSGTFQNCKNLTTPPPIIPSSVTLMTEEGPHYDLSDRYFRRLQNVTRND